MKKIIIAAVIILTSGIVSVNAKAVTDKSNLSTADARPADKSNLSTADARPTDKSNLSTADARPAADKSNLSTAD